MTRPVLLLMPLLFCAAGKAGAVSAQADPMAPLVAQIGANPELRRFYHGLAPDERRDFVHVYMVYAKHVALRTGQGWLHKNNRKVNDSIERLRIPEEIVALSLYAIEKKELAQALERQPRLSQSRNPYERQMGDQLQRRIEDLRRDQQRLWGRCGDWADEIQARLEDERIRALDIGHTELVGHPLLAPFLGASGEHASVRVCGKASKLCAVLDPWRTGEPAVLAASDWLGGGRIKTCLSNAQGEQARYCEPL